MKRLCSRLAVTAAATAAGVGALAAVLTAPAAADGFSSGDKVRCVGAVQTPGAFACYTSPRFDHVGLAQEDVADFPVVCYGIGCTTDELVLYSPDQTFAGRFIAVSYLGHSYTVYRPDSAQPYILTSDNPRLDPVTEAEVMLLEASLTAANS